MPNQFSILTTTAQSDFAITVNADGVCTIEHNGATIIQGEII